MNRWVLAVTALLACPPGIAAHELDEYLQASRISLTRGQVLCEIDLTPGAELASAVLSLVDSDGDGRLTSAEAVLYGRAVLRDLTLELDGRSLSLVLERVELPAAAEVTDGVGTIQVRAVADARGLRAGRREIYFRNDHHPDGGVYLVNALVPDDRGIAVTGQVRDRQQREIRVEYDVGPAAALETTWLLAASFVLSALVVSRRGGRRSS
jgi:hypothetical protein